MITCCFGANKLKAQEVPVSMCVGNTTFLTSTSNGTWTSSNNAVATISMSGEVTAISAGTVSFLFKEAVSNITKTTSIVTVNQIPYIKVPTAICIDCMVTMNTTIDDGIWQSSDPSFASVTSTGLIKGVHEGLVSFFVKDEVSGCSTETPPIAVIPAPSYSIFQDGETSSSPITVNNISASQSERYQKLLNLNSTQSVYLLRVCLKNIHANLDKMISIKAHCKKATEDSTVFS
jgi:uncharacterized protein YjdB